MVLGLVKRTSRDLKDIDTIKTLKCSLVKPLLECLFKKLETVILNITLINWRLFREKLPDGSMRLTMITALEYLS